MGLNAMLLRTASAIGEAVVAGLVALVGVALGTVALFAFYSLVMTTQDVVTWGGLTVFIVAVLLGVGAVRCINYAGLAFDRATRRLN
jgi:hypothetical protein